MNDERYAPPMVAVEESSGSDDMRAPPASVRWGVRILWAGVALAIPETIYHLFTPPAGMPLATHLLRWSLTVTVGFAIAFALYAPVSIGKHWARWIIAVLTVLFAAALVAIYRVIPPGVDFPRLEFTRLVLQSVMQVAAVVMLFTRASNAWFRTMRAAAVDGA